MFDYKDKKTNIAQLSQYMLTKTLSMFEYQGLPDTIPYSELEKVLQKNGYVFITEVDGALYALTGALGGELDAYYNPTKIIVSNPWLKFNKTLDLKTDGVLITNDDMKMGLMPLYEKSHTLMVENEINMVVFGYNTRTQKLISVSDDKTKASAELFIKRAIDGDISIIGENAIFDGVKVQGANTNNAVSITAMTEFQQYLKASLYNEVGLSSNFNMKRERLISSEVDQSEDSLFPFVYNMMKCRIKGIESVNKMYGLNIVVDFGSVWHFKNRQLVDDVIDPTTIPTEATEGEKTNDPTPDPTDTGTGTKSADSEVIKIVDTANDNSTDTQKNQIMDMLQEPELSESDKDTLNLLLNELETAK